MPITRSPNLLEQLDELEEDIQSTKQSSSSSQTAEETISAGGAMPIVVVGAGVAFALYKSFTSDGNR